MKKVGTFLLAGFFVFFVVGLLFPRFGCGPEDAKTAHAKNDTIQLVNSIRAYHTDYGYLPTESNEAIRSDRQLLSVPTGKETTRNPRKIVFLEVPPAKKKSGKWVGGIHPETGNWVDPYGNPYWLKIDADYDGIIYNPYASGAGYKKLREKVIVWSSGADGIFSNPKEPGEFRGSKDIVSWL